MKRCALVIALFACTCVQGAPLVGVLELRWGDPSPAAVQDVNFEARLVEADGTRHALDSASALRAAGNLFALSGRVIALNPAPGPWPDGRLVAEAIVAAAPSLSTVAGPRVSGSQPWVTIACKFSDVAVEPQTVAYFGTMLSNDVGRLDHYWREVSYNKVNVAGSAAYGWFTLPHPRSFYVPAEPNCSSARADLDALFADCTAAADGTVNFSPFVGINTFYNADLDGCAWGGGHYAALDGPDRLWYATWEPPWGYQQEAPLGHEMGHGFGLPHANNSDEDGDPYDNPWDNMSDSWDNATGNGNETYGWLPKHINIWSRDDLGWVDAARKLTIAADGANNGIVLDRASLIGSTNRQMIVVTLPAPEPATHYYVIEARKKVGTYELNLAGDAVIIHEVDTNRLEPSWSVDAQVPPADTSNNEGSMFKVGESWTAPGAAFKVDVVAATADGFVLNLLRGNNPDLIFRNGFDG